ncbi:MAG: SRPBCC domain-containing protein [Saprospiraceae bacterium]|nr:SRPBCC domain-containing protein [Saprospiraceae bacterium]
MKEPLFIKNEISIDTDADTLWDALTEPEFTRAYMFGCEARSEWTPGSTLEWVGNMEGKEVCFVKGTVVEYQPPVKLVYTTIDPNGDYEDIPENHLTVTYLLEEDGDGMKLSVSQGDYAIAEEGTKRYEESMAEGGWQSVLEKIKEILEQ